MDSLRTLSELSEAQLRELGTHGRSFVEARYDIRTLNRQLLDAAATYGRGSMSLADTMSIV